MASIVLGSLGSAVAGPIGGMLGSTAGSYLDNLLLNHKHINKPNFSDLLVEASTMGLPIPPVYGRAKLAGNLIMSSPLNAEKHSGKGGLSGSKGTPYYTYNANCAVAICRGPIQNIWRIFADSKLIWDMNPTETDVLIGTPNVHPFVQSGFSSNGAVGGTATLYHYGTGKESNNQFAGSTVNFHYGTEEQVEDVMCQAICEQATGTAALCPAYRGIAYAVFSGFPLADFGNRIPNFTFEVNGFGLPQNVVTEPTPSPTLGPIDGAVYINPLQNTAFLINTEFLQTYNILTCEIILNINLTDYVPEDLTGGLGLDCETNMCQAMIAPDSTLWLYGSGLEGRTNFFINVDAFAGVLGVYPFSPAPGEPAMFGNGPLAYCGSTGNIVVFDQQGHYQVYMDTGASPSFVFQGSLQSLGLTSAPAALAWADDKQQLLVLFGGGVDQQYVVMTNIDGGSISGPTVTGPFTLDPPLPTDGGAYVPNYDQTTGNWLFANANNVVLCSDLLTGPTVAASLNLPTAYSGAQLLDTETWVQQQLLQGSFAALLTGDVVHYLSTTNLADTGSWSANGGVFNPPYWYVPLGVGAIGSCGNGGIAFADNPTGGPLSLATIVEDICTDAGLPANAIDASALEPYEVAGYAVTNQASGRAALEPLQEAFLFDLVESNGKLVAKLRIAQAQNVSLSITESDLGARAASPNPGDKSQPKVNETVKQDFDLPQYVFFRYKTASGNFYVDNYSFEMATQYAKRSAAATGSTAHLTIGSPLCLQDSVAATIVTNILYLQYINRTSVSFDLPIKYLGLDAGDCVQLNFTDTEGNSVSYPVYLEQVTLGADNTIQFSGVSTNAAALTDIAAISQLIPGQPIPNPSTVPNVPAPPPGAPTTKPVPPPGVITDPGPPIGIPTPAGPAFLQIAETPPLQDSDGANAGFYWGACGVGTTWQGGTLYQSPDGGTTLNQIGAENFAAALGVTNNVLGGGANIVPGPWDLTNSVNIRLIGGGPLASVTPEQVCNLANYFLIGNEIIGAANVVQQADGSYTLSLLQRGVLGTDSAINAHTLGERTIALARDGSLQDYVANVSTIGLDYLYAMIPVGTDLTAARRVDYTMTGARIKPLPACHISLQRDASNNASLTWNPRNRINNQWLDGAEQGTCETAEAYEVDISNPTGSVVRTITTWNIGTATVGNTSGADTGIRQVSYTAAQQTTDGLFGAGETWNPSDESGITLSAGDLTAKNTSLSGAAGVRALTGTSSGRFYFELQVTSLANNNTAIGLATSGFSLTSELGADVKGIGARAIGGIFVGGTNFAPSFGGILDLQWAGVAVDLGNQLFWLRASPTSAWNGSATANPATGVGGISLAAVSGALFPCFNSQSANEGCIANFGGSTSVFAGAVPSGFSPGFPGPDAPEITATIYQTNALIGRGFPASITG